MIFKVTKCVIRNDFKCHLNVSDVQQNATGPKLCNQQKVDEDTSTVHRVIASCRNKKKITKYAQEE